MENEYPFRPRGRHGFDREDVINYITQAQTACNEHLARIEELETAKNAWYTQAKSMEREKAALVARNRELEEQLGQTPVDRFQFRQPGDFQQETQLKEQELQALKTRGYHLEQELAAAQEALAAEREKAAALGSELAALRERQPEPQDTNPQEQELQALKTRCLDLERERAELANRAALLESENAQRAESAEADKVCAECAALQQRIALLEEDLAAIAKERERLIHLLTVCERERDSLAAAKADYEMSLPSVQAQLTQLTESGKHIDFLSERNATLMGQAEDLRQQLDALTRTNTELLHREGAARREADRLAEEAEGLRTKIRELEQVSVHQSGETLRSMVLASFNYSDLYVGNNLKTAKFISDTTSQNISRVNDSASTLMEQVEAFARSFNDATDSIRRNLGTFQRELTGIQSGLNRRLSQDRFSALLEENERLRTRMEQELLEELESDSESGMIERPVEPQDPAQLPFVEDLPPSYHSFLDDE